MVSIKIVILNWNGRDFLGRFLPSVIENTPRWAEIVVADNGSTDDSVRFVESEFPSVAVLKLAKNYGFAEGYNRALAALEADYFVLLNSDAQPAPGWLEPLVERIESDERIAAVAPKLLAVNDRGRFEYAGASGGFIDGLGYPFCRGRILSSVEFDTGQYDDAREVFWGTGACLVVRSRTFAELGGFDADFFAHMEEIDFCWRAALAGYSVWIEPASVVYHLGGGTLPEKTPFKTYLNFRNNMMMLYKNLTAFSLFGVIGVRLVLDGVAAVGFLSGGRKDLFSAVWRAHRDFFRRMPDLRVARRQVQSARKSRSKYIYKGSIVVRYMIGRKYFGKLL